MASGQHSAPGPRPAATQRLCAPQSAAKVGDSVGLRVGAAVGDHDGAALGLTVGLRVGTREGDTLGAIVGDAEGPELGVFDGALVPSVGDLVGLAEGYSVGNAEVGKELGYLEGAADGDGVGFLVGKGVGAFVLSQQDR